MRITTGLAKGHRIEVPRGIDIRPTKDLVRQAIFSILYSRIRSSSVADFFAGSGALGLEALSRGAKECDFVDIHPNCCRIILKNLQHTALVPRGKVFRRRVEEFIKQTPDSRYDIIFADPPYGYPNVLNFLRHTARILKEGGIVVIEHRHPSEFKGDIDGLKIVDKRKYGISAVTFLRKEK